MASFLQLDYNGCWNIKKTNILRELKYSSTKYVIVSQETKANATSTWNSLVA